MKILHVIPSVSPKRGGPSTALSTMARALAQASQEVHIATTDDDGDEHLEVPLGQPIKQDNVTIWYFHRQVHFYAVSLPLMFWLLKHVKKFDVVHIHALFSFSTLAAAIAARWNKIPYIVRPLGTLNRWGMENRRPLLKQLSFRLIEAPILRHASLLHFTSGQERMEAEATGAVHSNVVLPIGIDTSSFEYLPSPDTFYQRYPALQTRSIILFLSRLDPIKGLDLLLPAFSKVVRDYPHAALVIAGSGNERLVTELASVAESLGIAEHVTWAGFLDGQDKLSALSAAEIFTLPSYSENFGIAVVEAMAAGLPVVISNRVGISPSIDMHRAGLVVQCDIDALSSALSRLIADAKMRADMGKNGRNLVREKFSLESTTKSLERLYRSVIDLRGQKML